MTRHPNAIPLTIRWIARIFSILSIGMILLFIFGEGLNVPHLSFSASPLLFLCFPLGISVGMIVAWWREGLGGFITVASLALFYLISSIFNGRFPEGLFFLIFSSPGFLFLISWLCRKRGQTFTS